MYMYVDMVKCGESERCLAGYMDHLLCVDCIFCFTMARIYMYTYLILGTHVYMYIARVTVLGLSLCVSVKPHLTSGASVCPENTVMYSVGRRSQYLWGFV